MTRVEREPIAFGRWMPVKRDGGIGYSYVMPRDGRTTRVGTDRWMRAKWRIGSSAIATGASEFATYGGHGTLAWGRTVTVTQDEADEFFRHAIEDLGHFMLKGTYRKACAMRDRRIGCSTNREAGATSTGARPAGNASLFAKARPANTTPADGAVPSS